ncbi:MAG: hypothetical protein K2W95_00735 [Candidatus Obscuribacterales bacterium]|nr:hypothetical protein [Candidatus Obscuribacterales bacterium]
MPLVVFSLLVVFAFLGFCVDVMRQFHCVEKLRFAARAAALELLPYASFDAAGNPDNISCCDDGGAITSTAAAQVFAALNGSGGPNDDPSNTASAGDVMDLSKPAEQPVFIQDSDVQSGTQVDGSAEDKNELLLRVVARRTGQDALQMMFMPVAYAMDFLAGSAIPPEALRRNQTGLAEVIGQPATRIGAAVAAGASGRRNQSIYRGRLAVFPLALEYSDFVAALPERGAPPVVVSLKVVDPGAATGSAGATPILRAYFVNSVSGASVSGYYSDAATPARFDELIGLLKYFDRSSSSPAPQVLRYPQAMESGVLVDCFSSDRTSFDNADLRALLTQLRTSAANRCFILPVVQRRGAVPTASQTQVQGFAWLKLKGITEATPGVWNFSFEINESLPLLNASCSGGLRSIPAVTGERMPAPRTDGPFKMRKLIAGSNSPEVRPRGVVLAPAVSLRALRPEDEV